MKTTTFRTTQKFALAAMAALCFSSVAVQADEAAVGIATRTVHYADLDLGTQAGAAVLHQRIRQAAEEVCGDPSSRQLGEALEAKACIARAVSTSERTMHEARFAANR